MPKIIRCAKCNRRLKYPVWIDGKPYGSTCATYIQPEIDYRAEIASLQNQVRELKKELQTLKMNGQVPVASTISNTNTVPTQLGMNYGADHGALMDELRSVLKDRVCACEI
jgi:hypothetical protein